MGADIEVIPAESDDAVARAGRRDRRPSAARRCGRSGSTAPASPTSSTSCPCSRSRWRPRTGQSELRDAAELRVKESDRIALVVANLQAIGVDAEERPDGWVVRPGGPREAAIRTAGDHRIAMAFAIAALTGVAGAVDSRRSRRASTVSYPGFWDDLAAVVGGGLSRWRCDGCAC